MLHSFGIPSVRSLPIISMLLAIAFVLSARVSAFKASISLKINAGSALINSAVRGGALGPMGSLISIGIGIVVVVLFAGLSIVGTQNSSNLISATTTISQFLPIIGLGIAVSILGAVLRFGSIGGR